MSDYRTTLFCDFCAMPVVDAGHGLLVDLTGGDVCGYPVALDDGTDAGEHVHCTGPSGVDPCHHCFLPDGLHPRRSREGMMFALISDLLGAMGATGTFFTRLDVTAWIGRAPTDEEWQRLIALREWTFDVPEAMVAPAWDAIDVALGQAGIR